MGDPLGSDQVQVQLCRQLVPEPGVHLDVRVVLELQQQLVEQVEGQPGGRRAGLQGSVQAEVLLAGPEDGGDVLQGKMGRFLQVAAVQVQAQELRGVALEKEIKGKFR